MKHLSTIGSAALLGSVGITVMSVLSGCEAQQEVPANRFLVIEQQANGGYVVVEETPTEGPNRAIIRETDGNGKVTERFMNEEEMKALAQQEYEKVEAGESALTAPPSDAGMGLAGTILAVAAGSLLGNMIGNALMGNKNFQKNANTSNKSAYHRSAANKASGKSSKKRSFFGGSKKGSSTTRSGSFGG
ncbi:MAG: hypothetical protein DRG24_10025 [Epsilonproteobacteria bacterium]|nr:MAG: hypothetical protein DRG24_10025 [Campylobacterota bacterium]